MKGQSNDFQFWFTDSDDLQGYNPYYASSTCREALACIEKATETKGFLEPNYGGTSTILNVTDNDYEKLSPWSTECEPCDGIMIKKEVLKQDHMALLIRSRDNIMLMIQDDIHIWLLSIGVDTLNKGILKKLPAFNGNIQVAISSCIGPEHLCYDFDHSTRISNFHPFGYSDFVTSYKSNYHIDIRGIVKYELKRKAPNFSIVLEDDRDTYLCPKLYSMRKKTEPVSANCMIIW